MSLMDEADNERAHAQRLADGNLIAVLLAQHAKIRDQFAAVRVARPEERRRQFDVLRAMLAVHEAGEEIVVRPLSRKSAGPSIAEARDQEEEDAAKVLAELEVMDAASEQFAQRLDGLAEAVSAHAYREETEELPALQNAHTEQELRELGERLLAAERSASAVSDPVDAGGTGAGHVAEPFSALVDAARRAFKD